MKINELLSYNYEIHLKHNNDGGKGEIKGSSIDLLVGISLLASLLKESGIKADEIKYAVELGLQDKKEIERQAKQNLRKMFDKLF